MSPTLQYTETLDTAVCYCGIHLAVPRNLLRRAKEDSNVGVYCPLGHQFFFEESEADRLKKRLAEQERQTEIQRARAGRLAHERDQIEARRVAQKAATTRAKRRHAAGVCPVCRRSFKQVRRHMASQHPDFDPESH